MGRDDRLRGLGPGRTLRRDHPPARCPLFAIIGVGASSVASFASVAEGIQQDDRNAERYARTRRALRALDKKLDDVRAAVADGDGAALVAYVEAVHDELSLEQVDIGPLRTGPRASPAPANPEPSHIRSSSSRGLCRALPPDTSANH